MAHSTRSNYRDARSVNETQIACTKEPYALILIAKQQQLLFLKLRSTRAPQ